jgi:hypothetical protein
LKPAYGGGGGQAAASNLLSNQQKDMIALIGAVCHGYHCFEFYSILIVFCLFVCPLSGDTDPDSGHIAV